MCGIFAIICKSPSKLPNDAPLRMQRALDAIKHRGPNARGTHIDPSGHYAIGHVRLSVIDLDESSNQPFWSKCGRYFVIFNGEIYNYLEIRAELEKDGITFRTKSDTEVLLAALIQWGTDTINRFNGMWTFVFGDTQTNHFVISRDRWGVKPLFRWEHDGQLILCSEAKGIIGWLGVTPKPNKNSIGLYLKYGIGGECEESWFEGINRFPQASFQRLDLKSDRVSSPEFYWNYPTKRTINNLEEAREQFKVLFNDAIKIRLRSDVPVGLSLSGGMDSGSIASIVSEKFQRSLQSYTAWHEPKEKSELPMARRIAGQFGHISTDVPETAHDQLVKDLKTCIYHLDAGHNSPAIVPYLNLCRAARSTLTVMLEGQGADELLGGYHSFDLFAALDFLFRVRFRQAWHSLLANAHALGWRNVAMDAVRFAINKVFINQARLWNAQSFLCEKSMNAQPSHLRKFSISKSNFNNALVYWHTYNLTNLLQYGDAVSMSVNLETRCPFLDYRLVEFGFLLKTDLVMHDGFGKYILRKCMEKSLPQEIVWRKKKDGFGNSTTRIIREVVKERGLPNAAVESTIELGIFKPRIRNSEAFQKLPENIQFRIYSVLLWVEIFYCNSKKIHEQNNAADGH